MIVRLVRGTLLVIRRIRLLLLLLRTVLSTCRMVRLLVVLVSRRCMMSVTSVVLAIVLRRRRFDCRWSLSGGVLLRLLRRLSRKWRLIAT